MMRDCGEDRFLSPAQTDDSQQVFGGHFVAIALQAALRTAEPSQSAHSLHSYFIRAGDSSIDIELQVERIRDGRSSCTRQVVLTQNKQEVFRLMASFSSVDDKSAHIYDAMPSAPHYSEVPVHEFDPKWVWTKGMEFRYVNMPGKSKPGDTQVLSWLRINESMGQQLEDPSVALAYLSDATVGDAVFLKRGWGFDDDAIRYLSLDHSVWFHRAIPAGEWLLFEQSSDWSGSGRGLSRTRVFAESGEMIASCAQEALAFTKS